MRVKVLSRDEEGALAREMEQGMLRALVAITRSPPAMTKVLEIVDQIERVSLPECFSPEAPFEYSPGVMP